MGGWGALLGAGVAIVAGFFTGGLSWAAVPVLAAAGAAAGAGLVKISGKALSSFGDTPANRFKNLGVDPQKAHEDAMKYRDKREDFLKEKNKEDLEAIDKLEKKLESLDDTVKNLQVETAKMDDSDPNKAAKLVQLEDAKNERDKTQKELDEKKKKVEDRNERLDKLFKEAGDPTSYTTSQYNNSLNNPYLGSYKNWLIYAFFIVIFFILIGFIKKLLNTFLSSIKG